MQRSARWLGFLISVTVTSVLSASAQAQVVGAKPITVIVPYATGGATDVVARMVAQQLGTRLGTPVIVENRQGGGGGGGGLERGRPRGSRRQYFARHGDVVLNFGRLDPKPALQPKDCFYPDQHGRVRGTRVGD